MCVPGFPYVRRLGNVTDADGRPDALHCRCEPWDSRRPPLSPSPSTRELGRSYNRIGGEAWPLRINLIESETALTTN